MLDKLHVGKHVHMRMRILIHIHDILYTYKRIYSIHTYNKYVCTHVLIPFCNSPSVICKLLCNGKIMTFYDKSAWDDTI